MSQLTDVEEGQEGVGSVTAAIAREEFLLHLLCSKSSLEAFSTAGTGLHLVVYIYCQFSIVKRST